MPLWRYPSRVKKMGPNIPRKKRMGKYLRKVINKIRAADSYNLPHFRLPGRCQKEPIPGNFPLRPKKPRVIQPLYGGQPEIMWCPDSWPSGAMTNNPNLMSSLCCFEKILSNSGEGDRPSHPGAINLSLQLCPKIVPSFFLKGLTDL